MVEHRANLQQAAELMLHTGVEMENYTAGLSRSETLPSAEETIHLQGLCVASKDAHEKYYEATRAHDAAAAGAAAPAAAEAAAVAAPALDGLVKLRQSLYRLR